ncbi:aspartic peptidase domain-containing protein [Terfezia claveryi]|nr:aspartic peptidase domain-containing protein [Terfezia claveryi]
MYIKYVVHGLVLSATVASAFNPYNKPVSSVPKVGSVGETAQNVKQWKPLKAPRDAISFQPVEEKPVDFEQMKPLSEMHIKKVPRADNALHPQIQAVQHANAVTKKFRKRGIPGPDIDRKLAIRNVISSLEKRNLKRGLNNFEILRSDTPTTADSMAVDQDGSDFSYFSEVQFGPNNKSFLLVIDTGSSDTWVPSSNCTSQACRRHETYGPSDSHTLVIEDRTFEIRYGTGNVEGTVARDDVSFAGFKVNIEFGLSTVVSSDFVSFPIDGIMGLGFPEASQQGASTIMDVLVKAKLIGSKMFSVALSRATDGLNDGVVHFGGIDKSYYTGVMTYSKSISDLGYWEIDLDDTAIDGKTLGLKGRTAIIDTGTSLILLPPDDAYDLHLAIEGARTDGDSFAVPCHTNKTLDMTFSGVTYKIPPIDWIGDPTAPDGLYCLSHVISRTITGKSTWLMGDVFLKNVYSNFDFDKSRIGFAYRASPRGTVNRPNPITTFMLSNPTNTAPVSTGMTGSPSPTSSSTSDSGNNGSKSAAVGGFTVPFGFVFGGFLLGLVIV